MPRPGFRRTFILLPNGFTLANLFLGVFAIVAASRGQFDDAVRYVVFGFVADALDGRIARATRTGSRFGSELDSLVDVISFGLAPAMIMYFAVLNQQGWDWLFVFLYVACAAIRLARFNVEQAGRAKTHFNGLPSPAAGMTLATYYWFSQTPLYQQTGLVDLPWHVMLRYVMIGLAFLMISNVKYAAVPRIGYKSLQEVLGSLVVLGTVVGVIFLPWEFFFPALMAYVIYGVARTVVQGLLDRGPDEGVGLDDGFIAPRADVAAVGAPHDGAPRRRRRRRFRRGRPGPPASNPFEEPEA
jgi:CDP-diacylglycerol--serine O-phosphatidyltransferase